MSTLKDVVMVNQFMGLSDEVEEFAKAKLSGMDVSSEDLARKLSEAEKVMSKIWIDELNVEDKENYTVNSYDEWKTMLDDNMSIVGGFDDLVSMIDHSVMDIMTARSFYYDLSDLAGISTEIEEFGKDKLAGKSVSVEDMAEMLHVADACMAIIQNNIPDMEHATCDSYSGWKSRLEGMSTVKDFKDLANDIDRNIRNISETIDVVNTINTDERNLCAEYANTIEAAEEMMKKVADYNKGLDITD